MEPMVSCEDAGKRSDELQVEYDQLVSEPRAAFKAEAVAEFGGQASVSYMPPEEHRQRIIEIVNAQRKISDGWCPVHGKVH